MWKLPARGGGYGLTYVMKPVEVPKAKSNALKSTKK
jgi:hypothetical protein